MLSSAYIRTLFVQKLVKVRGANMILLVGALQWQYWEIRGVLTVVTALEESKRIKFFAHRLQACHLQ